MESEDEEGLGKWTKFDAKTFWMGNKTGLYTENTQ